MKTRLTTVSTLALGIALAACTPAEEAATPAEPETTTAAVAPEAVTPPSREGLAAGIFDAGEAIWNLEHTATVAPPPGFFSEDTMWGLPPGLLDGGDDEDDAEDGDGEDAGETVEVVEADAEDGEAEGEDGEGEAETSGPGPISFANSDLAFTGSLVIMGNFHGFNIYDAVDADTLELQASVVCPGGQGDVSVSGNLVFMSVEQNRARLDCGGGGVEEESSDERFKGIRIFDISDVTTPRQVAAVQTCRGSHTHTLVPHPSDDNIAYIYVQGTNSPRPGDEMEGCSGGEPEDNPDTALYSIDVIEVPLDAPENARIINRPHIFADRDTGAIAGLWRGLDDDEDSEVEGEAEGETVAEVEPDPDAPRSGVTNHCHDITVYPHFNLAAGACSGNGILLDISDPANPARIDEVFDPAMAYWHSANFNNDATSIVFTDEWGGGLGPRCRPEDPDNWGANIIFERTENGLERGSFFKIPNTQTEVENCVAHNGAIIPVPGRDLMVQAWYSGGISIMDFTDAGNPYEIAYFDRGPVSAERLFLAGHWAAYWHNGRIYAPEIVRGLDVFRLTPSEHLSAAEIAVAEAVLFDEANTQTQLHYDWPADATVAQAYMDQLTRSDALSSDLSDAVSAAIADWSSAETRTAAASGLEAAAAAASGADADRMSALAAVLGTIE